MRNLPRAFALSILLVVPTLLTIEGAGADEMETIFGYDPDGRLTTGLYGQSRCLVFAYDLSGNRTSQKQFNKDANPPVWGSASWDGFEWSTGTFTTTWGVGTWGCTKWSEN